ncbi:programmed cell death protein 1 [Eublepharis macularius]|uniref:Programmed cell death protein 1 n=1 Tax=Eublepharis macularius TaxID=481883 RepID=A0AA97JM13_EUBMA|nr:programmed cell death protein 1 [Eublepharis macularius]
MESLQLAVMIETWALLLVFRSAPVVNQSVTCSPLRLTKPVGDAAVFTCQFSNVDHSEYNPNLYRECNESQRMKITELKENKDSGKYNISRVGSSHAFQVKILDLQKKDAGKYCCVLISMSSSQTVTESHRCILTVTERANTTIEPDMQEKEEEYDSGENGKGMPFAFIGGAGLILSLGILGIFLFNAIKGKQGERTPPAENAPLDEESPAANVFTVDYGILEFHGKAPPKHPPAEKTEYATIVFPTCKKSKKQRYCLSRTQLH